MKKILHHFLNLLYPRHCPVCHKILKDQKRLICPACAGKLQAIRSPYCLKCGRPVKEEEECCADCRKRSHVFTEGRGIFLYDEKMKESLMRYKYHGHREYGDFYAAAMCRYARKDILRWAPDVIVPIPLHRKKQRQRGFNQAEYLAERISTFYGIPAACRLLKKTKATRSQKKLSASERRSNLKGAFYAEGELHGKTVLLIDDVYTTGSTMDAAAECLREKGAGKIYFLTVCIGRN